MPITDIENAGMTSQNPSRLIGLLEAISAWAAIGVFGIGCLVIVGWIFGIAVLKSLNSQLISMKVNTAVAFMLTGIALWLSHPRRIHFRWGRYVAWGSAAVVAAAGLLTLMEYASGWNLGIDQLLFTEPSGTAQTIYPGRMAPNTALNFLLIGLSLILLDVRTWRGPRPAQYLNGLEGIIALMALVGYIYDVSRLFSPSAGANPMSLPAVLAGVVTFIGLGLARPGPGLLTLLTDKKAGSIMARRTLLPVLLVPIVLDLLLLTGQRAELFGEQLASGIHVLLQMAFFLGLVWVTAAWLNRTDSERHKAEEAQTRLASFPKLNPNPVAEVDLAGRVSFLNLAAERLLPDLQQLGAEHPYLADWRSIARTFRQGDTQTIKREIMVGGKCFQQVLYYVEQTESVRIYGMDITERKQAEETLRQSRKDLDRAQEVGQIGSWRLDVRRNVLTWSDENHRIFGAPKGTPMTYETFLGLVHPDDRQYVDTQWQAGLRGEPYDIEHRIVAGGQVKWVREKAYLEFDDAGKLLGGFGITQDITERKQAEEALKKAYDDLETRIQQRTAELKKTMETLEAERQRFNEVLDILPVYVILLTPDYHVPFANRFFRERFGESHGRRCYEYLFGRSEPCEICETYKALKNMAPLEWQWTGPDGRNYHIFDFPFTDSDGSTLILEMGIDVTEQKQLEEKLQNASLYARSLIEASLDPLVTISPSGQITDVNEATELITGVAREKLIGSDFSAYFTDSEKAGEGYRKVLAEGFVKDYPLTIRHTSGRTTHVHYNATVYRNEAGEVQGVFAAARDITERKQHEARLHTLHQTLERRATQLQGLASELTLTEQRERRRLAQILHDHLQQLLYAARLSLTTIRRRLQDVNLQHMVQHVDTLLGQCIDESRSLTFELSPPVLYDAGLAASLEWLARQMQQNYGLSVEVEADPNAEPETEDIKVLLFHSVRELLFNVVKHARASAAQVKMNLASDRQICIDVMDQGIGLNMEEMQTNDVYDSGFGLFSIRERLQQMGGQLEVRSAPGKGTQVSIIAPCRWPSPGISDDTARRAEPVGASRPSPEEHTTAKSVHKIRILLADDHALFRKGLLGVLNQEPDMEVVAEAADGEIAFEQAQRFNPDMVLMDVAMPNVDGIEATRRITNTLQGVQVIGLSAHKEEDMADALFKAGAIAYLSKDEPAEFLLATIRSVLSRPAAG